MHVQLRLMVGIGREILRSKNDIHLGDVRKLMPSFSAHHQTLEAWHIGRYGPTFLSVFS